MDSYDMSLRRIYLDDVEDKSLLMALLEQEGIFFDRTVEYTVGVFHKERLIGTGSVFKNTFRCLAVDSGYQGFGLLNRIISHLTDYLHGKGYSHLFLCTKPSLKRQFVDLGFHLVSEVPDIIVFMENRHDGISRYKEALVKTANDNVVNEANQANEADDNMATTDVVALNDSSGEQPRIGALVMNCNPFTLGHLHLVETAARTCDHVHLFVVSEEASVFPFLVRKELIKRGTSHLGNVTIHTSGEYMISRATFPSYFLKASTNIVAVHATLDLTIFLEHIVPTLGITDRFVGEEPYCEVTRQYVGIMKDILEKNGVRCHVIPRAEGSEGAISASHVRKAIREDAWDKLENWLPKSTYDYLKHEAPPELLDKVRSNAGRH